MKRCSSRKQIAEALEAAHEQGIIDRDPSNREANAEAAYERQQKAFDQELPDDAGCAKAPSDRRITIALSHVCRESISLAIFAVSFCITMPNVTPAGERVERIERKGDRCRYRL